MSKPFNQQTPAEREALKKDLKNCKTVAEALGILSARYDLENCKLGFLTGNSFADSLVNKALPALNPKTR